MIVLCFFENYGLLFNFFVCLNIQVVQGIVVGVVKVVCSGRWYCIDIRCGLYNFIMYCCVIYFKDIDGSQCSWCGLIYCNVLDISCFIFCLFVGIFEGQ